MSFLLHRDTCAAHLRGVRRVSNRLLQNIGDLRVSAVTVMELELWLLQPQTPFRCNQAYGVFLQQVAVLDVDDAIAHRAAQLASRLVGQRPRLPALHCLVAATARVHDLTLVTHAVQRFAQIPGLTVVDWMVP